MIRNCAVWYSVKDSNVLYMYNTTLNQMHFTENLVSHSRTHRRMQSEIQFWFSEFSWLLRLSWVGTCMNRPRSSCTNFNFKSNVLLRIPWQSTDAVQRPNTNGTERRRKLRAEVFDPDPGSRRELSRRGQSGHPGRGGGCLCWRQEGAGRAYVTRMTSDGSSDSVRTLTTWPSPGVKPYKQGSLEGGKEANHERWNLASVTTLPSNHSLPNWQCQYLRMRGRQVYYLMAFLFVSVLTNWRTWNLPQFSQHPSNYHKTKISIFNYSHIWRCRNV